MDSISPEVNIEILYKHRYVEHLKKSLHYTSNQLNEVLHARILKPTKSIEMSIIE